MTYHHDPAQQDLPLPFPELSGDMPLLPARMVNEYQYCPRLAYLEWVQSEWADSGDTVQGRYSHRRVDRPSGDLPEPGGAEEEERYHARSITLSSSRLGLIAKMDLLMTRGITISWHSFGGWFIGHTIGTGHKNVELRTAQYRESFDEKTCLHLAKSLVEAKILNSRNWRGEDKPESLLVRGWTVTLSAVGFDPCRGFYHQPRYGRPALALDLMEPFRPLIADSCVIQTINNGEVRPSDFVSAAGSVNLTNDGRKRFIGTFERRMAQEITHPCSATGCPTAACSGCRPACSAATCSARSPTTPPSRPDDAMDEHVYIVAYDIADPKRWRRVFRLMNGCGEWVQLSVIEEPLVIEHILRHLRLWDPRPACSAPPLAPESKFLSLVR